VALNLDSKKAVVEEVAEIAAKAHSAIAAEYRGLTVTELTELRKTARETGVYLRVVKNTLARRAVAGTEFECMQEGLVGPLLIAFSMEDPGCAARLINDFAKTHDKLIAKVVAINGQAYGASELARLASMPTRDQAIAMLMSVMKAPVGKLVRTLAAVRDQKEAA
jgi:large subunit ribosomal protein L10